MNIWIKTNRNVKLKYFIKAINIRLTGHYNYYGITDNFGQINKFYFETMRLIYKWLNRRSQRRSYTREGFQKMLEYYQLKKPQIKVNIYA